MAVSGNDFAYLGKRMDVLAKVVAKNAPLTVERVARAMAPELVRGTPKDSGRARANWQAANNSVPSGVLFAYPNKPGSPEAATTSAIAQIVATARAYPGGGYLTIANNVPYIQRLNEGWSKQAPAAFVEKAIMAGLAAVKRIRILQE